MLLQHEQVVVEVVVLTQGLVVDRVVAALVEYPQQAMAPMALPTLAVEAVGPATDYCLVLAVKVWLFYAIPVFILSLQLLAAHLYLQVAVIGFMCLIPMVQFLGLEIIWLTLLN